MLFPALLELLAGRGVGPKAGHLFQVMEMHGSTVLKNRNFDIKLKF